MAGFKNIQIAATIELYDRFMEAFSESGISSKAEFLRNLLYNEQGNEPKRDTNDTRTSLAQAKLKAVEMEFDEVKRENIELKQTVETLKASSPEKDVKLVDQERQINKLNKTYRLMNEKLKPFVDRVKDKPLYIGKRVFHVNNELDMLTLMTQTFKIEN